MYMDVGSDLKGYTTGCNVEAVLLTTLRFIGDSV